MKKVLFVFAMALSFSFNSNAQSGTIAKQNADAINNYDGVAGHFALPLSARENVNVNYAITPKHPTTVAHFMIHTPDAMPFWATVTNGAGATVYTWKPTDKVYLYNADWNVASLASGEYTVNIFLGTDPKSVFQFAFSK